MDRIKVNTNYVVDTAQKIKKINEQINGDFSSVEAAINNLNRNWDGSASEIAIAKFRNIRNTYYDNRYNVVNNMVNFMKNQVGAAYDEAEKKIVSAASAFK